FKPAEIHQPVWLNRKVGYAEALLFETPAGIQDCLVFRGQCNNVIALLPITPGNAFNRQIVRFRSAGGENDFLRLGSDKARHLLSGGFYGRFRFPSELVVPAGGVTEILREIREHRL